MPVGLHSCLKQRQITPIDANAMQQPYSPSFFSIETIFLPLSPQKQLREELGERQRSEPDFDQFLTDCAGSKDATFGDERGN